MFKSNLAKLSIPSPFLVMTIIFFLSFLFPTYLVIASCIHTIKNVTFLKSLVFYKKVRKLTFLVVSTTGSHDQIRSGKQIMGSNRGWRGLSVFSLQTQFIFPLLPFLLKKTRGHTKTDDKTGSYDQVRNMGNNKSQTGKQYGNR